MFQHIVRIISGFSFFINRHRPNVVFYFNVLEYSNGITALNDVTVLNERKNRKKILIQKQPPEVFCKKRCS